jgi:hypothetical protein
MTQKEAEDELIAELGLDDCDDPPSVGGKNFNVSVLWSALVKERMLQRKVVTFE